MKKEQSIRDYSMLESLRYNSIHFFLAGLVGFTSTHPSSISSFTASSACSCAAFCESYFGYSAFFGSFLIDFYYTFGGITDCC